MFDSVPAAPAGLLGSQRCFPFLWESSSVACLYMNGALQLDNVLANVE